MNYWVWLGKGLLYILTFRWVVLLFKNPMGEGILGVIFCVIPGVYLLTTDEHALWGIPFFIGAFLLFTHGMYRDMRNE